MSNIIRKKNHILFHDIIQLIIDYLSPEQLYELFETHNVDLDIKFKFNMYFIVNEK